MLPPSRDQLRRATVSTVELARYVADDSTESTDTLRERADAGDAEAQRMLGQCCSWTTLGILYISAEGDS
jgi:hypothetical protein